MDTLLIIILGILGDVWNFVSNNAGTIVLFIFGYIALKDIDRLRNDVSTLRDKVSKLEKNSL